MKEPEYCDIGLNLFCDQFPDPERIMEEAEAAGVCCILTGSDAEDNEQVNAYTLQAASLHQAGKEAYPVYGTAGIHPHNADRAAEADYARIREILTTNPYIVAAGEAGLDYNRMFSAMDHQIDCLLHQIAIAEDLGRPMFLHEREAAEDFIRIFRDHRALAERSVVHCYTGNRQELEELLDLGFSIGITGWICDSRRAEDLRDAVAILPLDRVLLETDAPYLTPRGIKGLSHVNVPQNISYVAQALAGYMHVDVETLKQAAFTNTARLFHINDFLSKY